MKKMKKVVVIVLCRLCIDLKIYDSGCNCCLMVIVCGGGDGGGEGLDIVSFGVVFGEGGLNVESDGVC